MDEITFEKSSVNVFADIGFTPAEAEDLTAKTALILTIKNIMAERALTQKQAARICGTDQPTLSKMMHGRMESVSIDRLAAWLTALGQDVEITVRPAPKARPGRLSGAATA